MSAKKPKPKPKLTTDTADSGAQGSRLSGGPLSNGSISRLISVAVLIVVIIAIGILFYRVMIGFFVPLFLAALLVVIFRPLHAWFCHRLGERPRVAALLTTAMILLIVLIPAGLILSIAAAQSTRLLSVVNSQNLTLAIGRARDTFGLTMASPELHREMTTAINQLADKRGLDETLARIEHVETTGIKLYRPLASQTPENKSLFGEFENQLLALRKIAVDTALREVGVLNSPRTGTPDVEPPDLAEEPAASATDTSADSTGVETAAAGDSEPQLNLPTASEWQQWQDYQKTLVEIDSLSNKLQNQLLGGPMRAELKLLANPSDQDIHDGLVRGRQHLQSQLPTLASATTEFAFHIVFGLAVLIIAIYFFLLDGPTMTRTLMRLSPLDDAYEERLLEEFDRTSCAVVLATILSALTQGILAAVGYYFAGMDSVVLLFLVTTFMALIPFLGAMSVWLPCVLWLGFVDQHWTAAIGLAIYGTLIVSTIDNVIKVFILHGRSQLHPLLALLSVLGGVSVFGPVGLLVGPMIVVFLQTLLEILHHELMRDHQPETTA